MYPKITDLNASVEDPRIMGVIREQGGKVRLGCHGYRASTHQHNVGLCFFVGLLP